jgi:hypothetical protein
LARYFDRADEQSKPVLRFSSASRILARRLLMFRQARSLRVTQVGKEGLQMSNIARLAGLIGITLTAAAMTFSSTLTMHALQQGQALASAAQMVQHG